MEDIKFIPTPVADPVALCCTLQRTCRNRAVVTVIVPGDAPWDYCPRCYNKIREQDPTMPTIDEIHRVLTSGTAVDRASSDLSSDDCYAEIKLRPRLSAAERAKEIAGMRGGDAPILATNFVIWMCIPGRTSDDELEAALAIYAECVEGLDGDLATDEHRDWFENKPCP